MLFLLKALARQLAVETPLRHLARPLYETATELELATVRAWDELTAGNAPRAALRTELITAVVKTFERKPALIRLVASLRAHFPALSVIVADDSREPLSIPGVTVIPLPFDVGVSAGRQAALERVRTPYTWLLDDDFVVFGGTRLDVALRTLEQNPQIDLLAGPLIYLPFLRKRRGDPHAIFPTSAQPVIEPGTKLGGCEVRDKVPNFYLARTDRLRTVGWTPELKRLDHADFFTRARGVLVSAFCEDFVALHAQTPFDRHYQSYRRALEQDRAVLERRYGR